MKTPLFSVLALILISSSAFADTYRYAIDYSRGIENTNREGGAQGIEVSIAWQADNAFNREGRVSFYIDGQLGVFESEAAQDKGEKAVLLSVSPMLRIALFDIAGRGVFVEGGIGASYLSDKNFAAQYYATHFQFRDRLALSAELDAEGDHMISVKRTHYSNADIDEPNPGFDTWSLSYSRRF